jgi:hypothetical protein
MGFSLSWLAIKGKSSQAIRDELGFRATGEKEEIPESELSAVEMPNGWYLIVSNRTEQVVPDATLQQLSSSGCELVTCFVEEHVMVSSSTGWRNGQMVWSVTHDAQKEIKHLVVKGEPPAEFSVIRENLFGKQAGVNDCDYIFDIPVETAKSVVGYRYYQDVPGLRGDVFEVLAASKKPSFFKKLFGR